MASGTRRPSLAFVSPVPGVRFGAFSQAGVPGRGGRLADSTADWSQSFRHDRTVRAAELRTLHPELVVDDPAWVASSTGGTWTWLVRMTAGSAFPAQGAARAPSGSAMIFGSSVTFDCGRPMSLRPAQALGRMLALVDALSYWKAAVPAVIRCHFPLVGDEGWWARFVAGSMAEFLWTNGLDPGWLPTVEGESVAAMPALGVQPAPAASGRRGSVVLLHSGGKDSVVAAALLHRAGSSVTPVTYRPSDAARRVVAASAPSGGWAAPPVTIERHLDHQILHLNAAGYLNGHTPYSAWLALAALAVADLTGVNRVAAGNGASDDQPNVVIPSTGASPGVTENWSVNHQWSKSAAFEAAWAEVGGDDRRYASPLRPLLELGVMAGIVAKTPAGAEAALSCNRAARAGCPGSWCGRCPKCVWSALALSALAGRTAARNRMGCDPLGDGANADLVVAMAGRRGPVPFECAGLPSEVRACLRSLDEAGGAPTALAALVDEDLDDGPHPPSVDDLVATLGPAPLLGEAEIGAAQWWVGDRHPR